MMAAAWAFDVFKSKLFVGANGIAGWEGWGGASVLR